MRFFGTTPITLPVYLLGKLSVLVCWTALVARWFWPALVWFRSPWLDILGAVLLGLGLAVLLAGCLNLGRSLRMGLPTEKTALRTNGVFQCTRNPIYVGGLLACLASIAWTANPIIIVLTVIAAGVHHTIVLAEERFLTAHFGGEWTAYAAKVRRYV